MTLLLLLIRLLNTRMCFFSKFSIAPGFVFSLIVRHKILILKPGSQKLAVDIKFYHIISSVSYKMVCDI